MNVISPDTHEVVFKIRGGGFSLLERKMFKCMAVICDRGGTGNKFARIRHTDFGVNDHGGVTRAQAIQAGIAGEYKGYIQIKNGYLQGKYSKGYLVTELGRKELKKVGKLEFKEAALGEGGADKKQRKQKAPDDRLGAIHRETLKGINLSNQFPSTGELQDPLLTSEFYRAYRRCKGPFVNITSDANGRIYYPLGYMKKVLRPLVTLEEEGGQPLAEVDIKCSGAQMMLKAGLVASEEKEKWADLIYNDQLYEYIWQNRLHRSKAKKGVNAVFNGSRGKSYQRMMRVFPRTTATLEIQTGLDLMKMESEIMNSLLEKMTNKGIPLLRLHDAFLCREADKKQVSQVMKTAGIATDHDKPSLSMLMSMYVLD
ncbi:hypothetical protein OAF01_00650 [bacterium]|nr:hypothetical protein [bacterium]